MEDFQEQHAIPQQISAYEFRLVGDMTLRQFFQLAAGALVSLVIYASNLPAIIKWPLILFSFLVGVAFAFFPLEDRPLTKWVFLFVKAIYSPTLYVWKTTDKPPIFFQPEPNEEMISVPQESMPQEDQATIQAQSAAPVGQQKEAESALKGLESGEQQFMENIEKSLSGENDEAIAPAEIPQNEAVSVDKNTSEPAGQHIVPADAQAVPGYTGSIAPFSTAQQNQSAQGAIFAPEASPPLPPTQPNIVVGQVFSEDGKIVEGVILDIRDEYGRPARALKTNMVGHFMIVTPLVDGKYQITAEKEGYEFETINLEVRGEIIPPIAITAKKSLSTTNNINNQ